MKKFLTLMALLSSITAFRLAAPLAIGVTSVAITACTTSKVSQAVTSIAALQAKVKTALDSWQDYVVDQKIKAGTITDLSARGAAILATTAKEAKVIAALNVYKAEAVAVQANVNAALLDDTDPAPTALLKAGNAFLATTATLSN